MTGSRNYYVYEHWRLDRDECFYVGKGNGGRAFSMKNRNRHHQAIVSKLSRIGSAFEVRIVASGLSEEEAFSLERERIQFWRESGADLTNMTNGGEGVSGFRHSDFTKKIWSEQRKGRAVPEEGRLKRSKTLKGRPKVPEHAKKAGVASGLAQRGKKHSKETIEKRKNKLKELNHFYKMAIKKPVVCVTSGEEFVSAADAGRHYNIPRDYVSSVCRGKRSNTKGLVFKFKETV